MGDFTNVDRVKRALRIPVGITLHDVRIGEIIGEVEATILDGIGPGLSSIGPTTVMETVSTWPGGYQTFTVKRWPVLSVAALTIAGAAIPATDFAWDESGRIDWLLDDAVLPCSRNGVQVQYEVGLMTQAQITAGATPGQLTRWATLECALQYNAEPMAGIGIQDIRPVRTTLSKVEEDNVRAEIRRIASRYLNVM